jgi:ANTAR domain
MTTDDWATGRQLQVLQGRRVLDTAEGILIGLRGCTTDSAFHELVLAAKTHFVPVFTIASALVELAAGNDEFSDLPPKAQTAARDEWSRLLDASPKMQSRNRHPHHRQVINR